MTAAGIAALAVVRVEGPGAAAFVESRLGRVPGVGRMSYGRWRVDGEVLDDPLVTGVSAAAFDVSLHGGSRIVELFLEDAAAAGFDEAKYEPADDVERWLPHATTKAGLRWTLGQRGLDAASADPADHTLRRLLVPARVAIVGPANAGKSTLCNRLAMRDASLVSPTAGTTRDYVETPAVLSNDLPLILLDTPGRREGADAVEAAAIGLSESAIRSADLVILLLDATRPADVPPGFADALRVWNKADAAAPPPGGLAVCAETGAGVDALERRIVAALLIDLNGPVRPQVFPKVG